MKCASHPLALFWFLLFFSNLSLAQTFGTLSGTIVDSKTQSPLEGVHVILQKSVLGASTDEHGTFTVRRIPPGKYTLQISMMGYKTKSMEEIEIHEGETTRLTISMEETVISVDPIVVTAGKHPQVLGSAHQAVAMISEGRLLLRQSRRLEEALSAVSGIHFNEENISIRGSGGYSVFNVGSRVLLMIDGVPALTSDLGAINWEMLPLLDVDRIEVVKGAGSALYGSSALGGMVNILTRTPSRQGRWQIRTLSGMYDQPYYKEWHWTTKTLHYERADLAYSRQVGALGFRFSLSGYNSTGYMENNEARHWNATGRFVYQFPNSSRLDVYVAWMQDQRGGFIQWLNQNRPFEVPPFNKKDKIHYQTANIYARYNLPISAQFGLTLRISHLLSKMGNQLTAYDPGAFTPGQGFGLEVQGDWLLEKRHHVTFGNEFRWDISGSEYFGNHRGVTLSPYLQNEWTISSRFKATLGMRLDHHVLMNETTDTRLSPKVGLNFPLGLTVLRTTLGSGFRAATVFEKYIRADYSGFNIIPNPDLKSERSWFWDVGIRQTFQKNFYAELSIFQSDTWDMIEPVVNFLGTIQFQNYMRARIRGLEFEAESWWRKRLSVSTSVTWIDPRDIVRDECLPYRPRISSCIVGTFYLGPFSLQGEYLYASRIEKVEINPLDPRVPLKLLHVRAQAKWNHWTLQLAVNNVLNYHYAQVERRMGEVRNFSLGLLMDFGELIKERKPLETNSALNSFSNPRNTSFVF